MNMELNKIAGAILGAGVFSMGLGILSDAIFHQKAPEKPGFIIATAEAKTDASAPAEDKAAPVAPIEERLKAATPEDGKKVFAKCTACHNAEKGGKNGTGPNLFNVVGATSGMHEGYTYSAAMAEHGKAGGKWTFADLDKFLTKPSAFVPKTKMGYDGIKKPEERAAVIRYLAGQADSPVAMP